VDHAFNSDNQVLPAVLSMTNAVPSNAIERVDEDPKAGGGDVRVTGPYTGADDATLEIEIVDEIIEGPPSVSAPTFAGVGNGEISGIEGGDGMQAESITIVLKSTGTETRYGENTFMGVLLRAREPGDIPIFVTVTPNLTFTDTEFSLREALPENVEKLFGLEWNFGASPLVAGLVSPAAPRLAFGSSTDVYRHYSGFDFTPGAPQSFYGFSPRPRRAIAAGARVKLVTGGYSITITDGTTVETIPDVATLFDAADMIHRHSTLIKVMSAIVADRKPGGMAAMDINVRTQSYCEAIAADGGQGVQRGDIGLIVGPNAPTENLFVTFLDGATAEIRGDVSGLLGTAQVGVRFESEHYSLLIPAPPTTPGTTSARIMVRFRPATRDGSAPVPGLCADIAFLGIAAKNGTDTFTYAPLPPPPCDCVGIPTNPPPPKEDCLGIQPQEGNAVSHASLLRRVQEVQEFVSDFTLNNTYVYAGYEKDIAIANRGADIYLRLLDELERGTLTLPKWTAGKVYKADEIIEPPTANGFRYAINTPGTAHTSAPTWPTTIGETVTDGAGVVYECIGKTVFAEFDDAFKVYRLDMKHLFVTRSTKGASAQVWQPNLDITGELALLPTTDNGHYYTYEAGSWPTNTGDTEPTWPTDGGTVAVGGLTYRDAGLYEGLLRETVYAEDDVVYSAYHGALRAIVGGETAVTMPGYADLAMNDEIVDGEVTWKLVGRGATMADGTALFDAPEVFFERYNALANKVLSVAGIAGNFSSSSTTEGCWTPKPGATGAFFHDGAEPTYMEMYPNHPFYTAQMGPGGIITSTREWYCFPSISCPDNLIPGDQVAVIRDGINGVSGGFYQQGDQWACQITKAVPMPMVGGQIGDDTLVFSVTGSVSGPLRDYLLNLVTPVAYNGGSDAWEADAEFVPGDYARPTSSNGLRYRASMTGDTGMSGSSEPTWPTDVDDTVVDGDVTWTCIGPDTTISFLIEQGGIPFAIADEFVFSLEGAHAKHRINGGIWSDPFVVAASVDLGSGLTAVFTGGSSPSWKTGDRYTYQIIATSGVGNLRRPTGRSATWLTSTVIDVAPISGTANRLIIAGHRIPSNATITLQGSDNDFADTPLDVEVPWQEDDIHFPITTARAKYRILVSTGGSIYWLFIGTPLRPTIHTGATERGVWEPRFRLPTQARAGGVGGRIEHEWLPKSVAMDLIGRLKLAAANDEGRYAIIPNVDEPEVHRVAIANFDVPVNDLRDFKPRDTSFRRMSLAIDLEPAA
jgi:hypothetical protein